MSEEAVANHQRRPWHLWLVGILGLLWNLVGAYDYLMTETQNESYLSKFSPEQLEYFSGFPSWVVATWAIAVWGGVLGVLLLLLRKRLAAGVLLGSFLAMIITSVYNFLLSDGLEVMGSEGLVFSGLILAIGLGLWVYARSMARKGVLI
jgi:hypothetical protein